MVWGAPMETLTTLFTTSLMIYVAIGLVFGCLAACQNGTKGYDLFMVVVTWPFVIDIE